MAEDRLMFPIGFDLDSATKEAANEWNSKYAAQLEKAIQKRPIKVKLAYDIKQLDNLEAVQKRLKDLKLAPITPETKGAISSLISELKKLETILTKIDSLNSKTAISTGKATRDNIKTLKAQEDLNNKVLVLQERLKQAQIRTAIAQERYNKAVNGTARAYSNTAGYIERLIKRTLVLFGIRQVARFAERIRETTAEFELQLVSLGAIIQDTEKANALFNQIKTFAVQSPFEIKDLIGYVKQLSAYRIETDKLFDTTKRLADVSAGLGVDMGRLILAYGQVKAASVLRGQEVRQFTEAGIPLIQLLADKFTALRGEVVSTSEVFDLISQRAVSFEMVAEIFEDMTNAGGMFYNMQEKQAQTLAGQWSNLKDSLSIMYDEIGNTKVAQAGIRGIIDLTKTLAENWDTTYQVIEGATIAIAAMSIAHKNAAMSLAKLSKEEAYYTAVKTRQIRQSPRWIAAIIGERNARILSIAAAKAHTSAMVKQATATNILSKSFWKLTTAMLSNPYVLITGVVVALGYAIFRLATNSETAKDRVKSLNNAVGSMQQHTNTVKPLIESYNELSNKLERTAAEEKKLQKITQELANRYPSAVKAVKDYGAGIELLSDKLNELYEAEMKARREVTEAELKKTEQRIEEEEERIAQLQEQLNRGTKLEISGSYGIAGVGMKTIVPLNENDKKNIIEQINEIRTGTKDGSGTDGLIGLYNSATNAKRALGLIPSEAAANIDAFQSWKKTIQEFSKNMETASGVSLPPLFDDQTIDQFKSLDDALKNVAERYKTNKELVEEYNRTLKSTSITDEERESIQKAMERAQTEADTLLAIIDYYNQRKLLESKGGGTDDRLSNLKELVSLLEKVYNNYKEYTKYVSEADAQERINREFGKTLEIFKKYEIELPKTSAEYQKALKKLQDAMRTLPKSQKDVLEIGFKIEKVDFEDTKNNLEKELKRLADEVSRTKTAKEFFDKMLNLTGDRELSTTVSMSVYGGTGNDLKQRIIDQIRDAFKTTTGDELDLSLAINYNTLEVDYLKLAQLAEKNKDILLSASKATRDGIIKAGLESTAARIMQWEKDIQKDQTYSEKRIRLAQETAQKIADIEVSNIPKSEKKRLQEGYRQREQAQSADLAWGAFKDSPIYVQMFDNLETASTTMLNAMLDKLKQLKSQWGESLSPTELKELQNRMNEIEYQLANKNPFKTLTSAIKEYRTLTKEKSYNEAVQELAKNMQQADLEAKKYAEALRLAQEAEQYYIEIKQREGEDSEATNNARKAADAAWDQAKAQQKTYNSAQKLANKSQETVDAYKKTADKVLDVAKAIKEWTNKLNVAFDGIRDIMDAFGAAEEDLQFFDDLVGGFNKMSQGAEQGAQAISSFMSGDTLGGITGAIGSIGSIISGFTDIFYAGRIRRANKEIERQQKLLDSLEHSYDRLQKAVDKVFGGEFIDNINKQAKNVQAQIAATQKQLAAERSKGKKTDDEKVKEYEKKIQSLQDELADMQGKVAEQMLGADLTSAARSFAQAWLDAYKEFGDTRKAIEDEMQKMIENLIVEAALGAVIQKALEPVFKMIDEATPGALTDPTYLRKVLEETKKASDYANTAASIMMDSWEEAGYNFRDLGSDMSGISKDIATASEESILGLSSLINTSLYYVSNIDRNVAQIVTIISGGGYEVSSGELLTDLITIQNQHLAYLPSIALNTAQTADRCERAAAACENIAENLNRVIKPNGVQGSYKVNTSL